jgi:predicted lipoprotein with Yx(FWY)xxD motif
MRRVVLLALVLGLIAAATATARSHQASSGTSVKAAFSAKLKTSIVVTSKGLSLYYWVQDFGGKSNCVNDPTYHCTKVWPPLMTTGAPVAGKGIKKSLLGTTKRSDGGTQVTYAGHPLYRWAGTSPPADKKPGDVNGQGVIQEWWALTPAGKPVKTIPK